MKNSTTSERFRAADSDITLRSSDGVDFQVHRINLKMHSDIFAAADDISSSIPSKLKDSTDGAPEPATTEVVPLPENSATLDLLLQYMYRQAPPDLSSVTFEVMANLAEAAEKYTVYFAIDATKRAMRDAIPDHCCEVLNWAIKHKHESMIDEAARVSVGASFDCIRQILPPSIQSIWFDYHNHWLNALNAEYARHGPTTMHWNSVSRESDIPCEHWSHSFALISHRLAAKPQLLQNLQSVFGPSEEYLQTRCGECRENILTWKKTIGRELEKIPRFSAML